MGNDNRLKCGVVGVGYLGEHHVRIFSGLPDCDLVGVFDVDGQRARNVASDYGCTAFTALKDLAAACEAVSVVVPTDRHTEVALALLQSGCNLLIEKPICASLEDAEAILKAARIASAIVQVGHVEHYNPVMTFLENAIDRPMYITAERLSPFEKRGTEVGVVLDLMIHDIGIILELVRSPVERIEAVGVRVLSANEDIANARLVFENGCVANINASRVSSKKVREIRFFQPSVYLSLDFMNQAGHLLRKEGKRLAREEIPISQGEPLTLELASFAECVRRLGQPKVGPALGISALEIAIRITEQIGEQQAAWDV